jgi:hypothetical protein
MRPESCRKRPPTRMPKSGSRLLLTAVVDVDDAYDSVFAPIFYSFITFGYTQWIVVVNLAGFVLLISFSASKKEPKR